MSIARYRIRILGLASGVASDVDGAWVRSSDPEAFGGRGALRATRVPSEALTFAHARDAWTYWGRTSTTHPTRPDGKPNRPLTAYSVIVEPIGRVS